MTTAELTEYLGVIVQMEKEVNLQEQLVHRMNHKVDEYDDTIADKVKDIAGSVEPAKPKIPQNNKRNFIISGICCSIIVVLLSIYLFNRGATNIIVFDIIVEILLWVRVFSAFEGKRKKDEEKYKIDLRKYEIACNKIQSRKEKIQEQLDELRIQKQSAEVYRQKIEDGLTSSQKSLASMYAFNILFPKYRNYIMTSSIYEYLCAGRCTTLEGHEGAYNILEMEIRLDRIVTQLDDILKNITAIQTNQYMLYCCLRESNSKMNDLLKEESRIADSMKKQVTQMTAVNARLAISQRSPELDNYITDCRRRELEYMNRANRIF